MENTYSQFSGYQSGTFETKDGSKAEYRQIFVLTPMESVSKEDYRCSGYKAEKLKISADALQDLIKSGINPGDKVDILFNRYGQVCSVKKI